MKWCQQKVNGLVSSKPCSFLQIVLSSFFANFLYYFAKLGIVQRNLEPKRVFPGTWWDLKCSRDASFIQPPYPSRPLQTLLLKHHCSSTAFEQLLKHFPIGAALVLPASCFWKAKRICSVESWQSMCTRVRKTAEFSTFINSELYAVTRIWKKKCNLRKQILVVTAIHLLYPGMPLLTPKQGQHLLR